MQEHPAIGEAILRKVDLTPMSQSSFGITTSVWTARAIQTGSLADDIPLASRSSPWPTHTTR